MKKLFSLLALILLGVVQIYAQVETGMKIKKNQLQTREKAASIDVNKIIDVNKRNYSPKIADKLNYREELIEALTKGDKYPNYVISASHRAQYNGGNEPENSMEAIVDVLKNKRADIVELDIKKSKDDTVYVMHDNYLQRTTDFLDKFTGLGKGSDQYGHYNNYVWEQVALLKLKRPDFSYTDRKVPTFRNVLRYVKAQTQSLINLDIGDMAVFKATWEVVMQEDAFNCVIFKTAQLTVNQYKTEYYDKLTAAQKQQVIFFPMIVVNNPECKTPLEAYNNWEASGLAKGYELGYRTLNATNDPIVEVAMAVRKKNRVRVHVFNTYPDTYEGRYRGNVNIDQCCNDAYDARGDWGFLLDPRNAGTYADGSNGYIITDDPELLDDYLSVHELKKVDIKLK